MKHLFWLTIFAAAFVFFSCTGNIHTFSEYNKTTDLSKYRTYAWIAPDSKDMTIEQIEGMYGKLIMSASNDVLKKKGMIQDTKQPDALFKFAMGVGHQVQYSQSPTLGIGVAGGGPYYYGGVVVPVAGGQITEHDITEATIYIQMYDAQTGYLLWTGGARKNVDNSADTEKNMRLALSAIYSRLPIYHK